MLLALYVEYLQQVQRAFFTLGYLSIFSNIWEPPYPYIHPWEDKRSLPVISRLLGLIRSEVESEMRWWWWLQTHSCLLVSCLHWGTWINWQPMCQGKLTVSHLTPAQCGSCTCRVCAVLAMKSCIWRPLISSTEASARQCKIILCWSHWGFLGLGKVFGVFFVVKIGSFFSPWDWNLNPIKWNEKKIPTLLSFEPK